MNKQQRQKLMRKQKKTWQSILSDRELEDRFSESIVRYCSLAKNGLKGKGAVKSQGKITVRHLRDVQYNGGARVFSQQDGWHSARSWVRKRKFQ